MAYGEWKKFNDALNLVGKKVLVVGGTAGIGEGIAIRYSQLGASVFIAGRNEDSAKKIISKMNEHKKDSQEFGFFKVDASSVKDLKRFTSEAKEYFSKHGGIDHIVQSQGILNAGPQTDTPEGIDQAFMINAFSRWKITKELSPLLHDSCIYICNPVKNGSLDFDDMEMKKNRPMFGPGQRDGTFIDAITKEFQEVNQKQRFYHLFPGFVKTNVMQNTPGVNPVLSVVTKVFAPLGRDPVSYADAPVYLASHENEFKKGFRYNDKLKVYNDYEWILNPANRRKLWQWNEDLDSKF